MALAMEREQIVYSSLQMVAGAVVADPEPMLSRTRPRNDAPHAAVVLHGRAPDRMLLIRMHEVRNGQHRVGGAPKDESVWHRLELGTAPAARALGLHLRHEGAQAGQELGVRGLHRVVHRQLDQRDSSSSASRRRFA